MSIWKGRNQAADEPDENGEPITGIPLKECRERGRANAKITNPEDPADDPDGAHVRAQGGQSDAEALAMLARDVDERVAEHSSKRTTRQLFEPDLKIAARIYVIADRDLRAFLGNIREIAWRLPFLGDGSPFMKWIVLLAIAAGEYVLNREAFAVTGESNLNVDVLAVVVGVVLVVGAELSGVGLRRVIDRPARVERPGVGVALLSVVIALPLAVVSIGFLRHAFYTDAHLHVPWIWLCGLQTFLLWVAVAVSMAHASPLSDERERLQSDVDDAAGVLGTRKKTWCDLRDVERREEGRTHTTINAACQRYVVQVTHTNRGLLSFGAGVQEAAGTPVSAKALLGDADPIVVLSKLPDLDPVVQTWIDWLAAHPAKSESPDVVEELEELLASVADLTPEVTDPEASNTSRADTERRSLDDLDTFDSTRTSSPADANGSQPST